MTDREFYEAEAMRWPELHGVPISNAGAKRVLKWLTAQFKILRVPLTFIAGNISWGGCDGIELAESRDWLVFAHEFAHVLDCVRHGYTDHTARMARIVDEVSVVITNADWVQNDLDLQVDGLLKRHAQALGYTL